MSSSRSSLSVYPVGGWPGLHETLSSENLYITVWLPPCTPSWSLRWPLSPHRGRRVNCTVRTRGSSKAEVSSVRLCPPQAIPATPLSGPTTSVQYTLPVGSLGTVLSPQPFRPHPTSPGVRNRIAHPHTVLFLLLNPFGKLQTSCVLLIRARESQVLSPCGLVCDNPSTVSPGTNQGALSLQCSRCWPRPASVCSPGSRPTRQPLFWRSLINRV